MAGTKGRSGRRRKPDSLKIIQGTFQKCRSNPKQPKPKTGIPRPHFGLLSKEEKKHYKRLGEILEGMNIVTEADVFALELLAQTMADYTDAVEELKGQEIVLSYTNKNGVLVSQKNPLISIINDYRKIVINLLSRFGLEPSARASLNIVPEKEDEQDNPWKDF